MAKDEPYAVMTNDRIPCINKDCSGLSEAAIKHWGVRRIKMANGGPTEKQATFLPIRDVCQAHRGMTQELDGMRRDMLMEYGYAKEYGEIENGDRT